MGDTTERILGRRVSVFHLAPINTGFADAVGAPTARLRRFHQLRSGPSIGISYVGNVAVESGYVTNQTTLVAGSDRAEWDRLVEEIYGAGSLAGVQLACRLAPWQAPRNWQGKNDRSALDRTSKFVTELDDHVIDRVVDQFRDGIRWAAQLGFSVVQVHAAHGYFLSLLLDPRINRRTGRYAAHSFYAVDRLQDAFPSSVFSEWRISVISGISTVDEELEIAEAIVAKLVGSGVNGLSISAGHYEVDKRLIYPHVNDGPLPQHKNVSRFINQHPHIVWNLSGNVFDLDSLLGWPDNHTFSIGRALIADPHYIEKYFSDRRKEINQCKRTNKCHFYSRGKVHLECGVNGDI